MLLCALYCHPNLLHRPRHAASTVINSALSYWILLIVCSASSDTRILMSHIPPVPAFAHWCPHYSVRTCPVLPTQHCPALHRTLLLCPHHVPHCRYKRGQFAAAKAKLDEAATVISQEVPSSTALHCGLKYIHATLASTHAYPLSLSLPLCRASSPFALL
jgi:hypothetical protein